MGGDREARLAAVLLVRALEEEDQEGRFLGLRERRRATKNSEGEGDAFEARADVLLRGLWQRHRRLEWAHRIATVPVPRSGPVALGLGVGFLIDAIGNHRHVSLLSFPLLGLIAWNLVVYITIVFRPSSRPPLGSVIRLLEPRRLDGGEETDWIGRSLFRFAELWGRYFREAAGFRVRSMLHTTAAVSGSATILGMYVRGFGFEYRATWESTFLDPESVHTLLSVLFAPAAMVLQVEIPDSATIAALRAPRDGPAALWIHLWSITSLLLVVAPRSLLAIATATRARRCIAKLELPIDDAYRRQVLGNGERPVDWLSFAHRPSLMARERIQEEIARNFGPNAFVRELGAVEYGTETIEERTPGASIAVVFNLAQTPEVEVHGKFVERLSGDARVAFLDAEPFAPVVALGGRARLEQRVKAWEQVLSPMEVAVILVNAR